MHAYCRNSPSCVGDSVRSCRTFLILVMFISPDDLTGQVLAYTSLLPIAILVGFVTLIVFKRELHTVSHVTSQTSSLQQRLQCTHADVLLSLLCLLLSLRSPFLADW